MEKFTVKNYMLVILGLFVIEFTMGFIYGFFAVQDITLTILILLANVLSQIIALMIFFALPIFVLRWIYMKIFVNEKTA